MPIVRPRVPLRASPSHTSAASARTVARSASRSSTSVSNVVSLERLLATRAVSTGELSWKCATPPVYERSVS